VEVAQDYGLFLENIAQNYSLVFLIKHHYLKERLKYESKIFNICQKSLKNSSYDLDFIRIDHEQFRI
jgi:mannose-1-phosphate guanylyltransferase